MIETLNMYIHAATGGSNQSVTGKIPFRMRLRGVLQNVAYLVTAAISEEAVVELATKIQFTSSGGMPARGDGRLCMSRAFLLYITASTSAFVDSHELFVPHDRVLDTDMTLYINWTLNSGNAQLSADYTLFYERL